MKLIKNSIAIFIFFGSASFAFSQTQDDPKKLFDDAQALYVQENYAAALPIFLKLSEIEKDNANIAFKIGNCYLNNTTDEKLKALPYLERASKKTTLKADENSYKENNAPVYAYYLLGRAYHLNYQFDYAIESYKRFKTNLADKTAEKDIDHQIQMCVNAKEIVAAPVTIQIENLGPNINSPYAEYSPVLAADESTIFFTSRKPETTGGKVDTEDGKYYEDIYYSVKKDNLWSPAVNIGAPINTEGHEATIGVSIDGQKLLIYRDDKGDGNIYTSTLDGANWSAPAKLNENINTKLWEPSASISPDGTRLYFASDREGGFGGRDLFMCKKLPNGEWSKAVNLGPTVNTAYDEDAPFIHPDGVTMFFSSNGHKSMGGFDIFFTALIDTENEKWLEPVNIGYPVNSVEDDVFYFPSADNKRAYYSSYKSGGYGEKDIYMLTFPEQKETPLTVYKGVIKSADGGPIPPVEITVINNETGELVGSYYPNSKTGKYLFILPPGGNYNISYAAEGFVIQSENMEVPKDSYYSLINNAIDLKPLTVGQRVTLKYLFFVYNKATIRPASAVELDKFHKLLTSKPGLVVEISGHTDSRGNDDFNMKLSQARAQAVVDYMVKKGIEAKRMVAVGYGETKPIAKNTTSEGKEDEEGMQLNRRVEYRILSTDSEYDVIEKIKVPENLKVEEAPVAPQKQKPALKNQVQNKPKSKTSK